MTVRDLVSHMGAGELVEWEAYDALEPIGAMRDDFRVGWMLAHTLSMWADGEVPDVEALASPFWRTKAEVIEKPSAPDRAGLSQWRAAMDRYGIDVG